ncbi:unnamed protein product [marine sediment metagenome]|uniref:Uncharacterized protein n=1 Tax=marine sediment metagenome TaxID=412755 RepID=X0YRR6_9ZZZZ
MKNEIKTEMFKQLKKHLNDAREGLKQEELSKIQQEGIIFSVACAQAYVAKLLKNL